MTGYEKISNSKKVDKLQSIFNTEEVQVVIDEVKRDIITGYQGEDEIS